MLSKLKIQNFALIDKLEIEFGKGFNVITGATGAGKSIIIGALDLALGGRGSEEIIRSGESNAVVEAEFHIDNKIIKSNINSVLGFKADTNPFLVRREYRLKGGGRAFIGDSQVNISTLRAISVFLADILGQHSHQTLLDNSSHREFLDIFAGLEDKVNSLKTIYAKAVNLKEQIKNADSQLRELTDKIELLGYQVNEIEQATLELDEDDKLKAEKKLLENSHKIKESAERTCGQLMDDENSAMELVANSLKQLESFAGISDDIKQVIPKITASSENIRESVLDLKILITHLEFDPQRLEFINDRLNEIYNLKKKYGQNIDEVIKFAQKGRIELQDLKARKIDYGELNEKYKAAISQLNEAASEISNKRIQAKSDLEKNIGQRLFAMGMPKAQFAIDISRKQATDGFYLSGETYFEGTETGFDIVEFQFCANPGEGLKPLAKIASGGEISRVMLAIKNSISDTRHKSCEIFDEVDVGISGEVAFKVAKQLKELSKYHQVICITHLHQIASLADHHYRVYKQIFGGRNITRVKLLAYEERIEEIASLISGEKITDAAMAGAKKLLEESNP